MQYTEKNLERLSQMVSLDHNEDNEIEIVMERLLEQQKIDGTILADYVEGVSMWQPMEFSLTVNQLLETI